MLGNQLHWFASEIRLFCDHLIQVQMNKRNIHISRSDIINYSQIVIYSCVWYIVHKQIISLCDQAQLPSVFQSSSLYAIRWINEWNIVGTIVWILFEFITINDKFSFESDLKIPFDSRKIAIVKAFYFRSTSIRFSIFFPVSQIPFNFPFAAFSAKTHTHTK